MSFNTLDTELGDQYIRAHNSVPSTVIRDGAGTTSSSAPFYYSIVTNGVHYASVYNDTDNHGLTEGHYINGVLSEDDVFIERSESFSGCLRYEEGCNHYSTYALWEYNTLNI